MESAGLRHRDGQARGGGDVKTTPPANGQMPEMRTEMNSQCPVQVQAIIDPKPGPGIEPPRFTVDLSLPPEERYNHIVPHLEGAIADANLTGLFDDLVRAFFPPPLASAVLLLARLALRRVYSREETAELRGISRAAGVPMHLLVAFNVVLDLLLGCTSGGVRVEDPVDPQSAPSSRPNAKPPQQGWRSRILHFRTLDWGMEPLRQIVVELDFVRSAGGPVVATSVTYFGYVGVLTGVRRGLSMSLNFRPRHDRSTRRRRLAFRLQQVLVVLGLRQSVSSVLRHYLLGPEEEVFRGEKDAGVMQHILDELSTSPSTAAYLIFCMPQHVYSVEKDHRAASVRHSAEFLTTYNHDAADEEDPSRLAEAARNVADEAIGMDTLVEFSCERKRHVDQMLRKRLDRRRRKTRRPTAAIGTDDVLAMVKDEWVSNEESHYAVIMDPESGRVLWRRLYPT